MALSKTIDKNLNQGAIKEKLFMPSDPAFLPPGMYPTEIFPQVHHKRMCSQMLTAVVPTGHENR